MKGPNSLCFILSGYVFLEFKMKHFQLPVGVLKAGAVLNYDRAALSTRPHVITVTTMTDVTCAWLPYEFLDKFATKYLPVH